MFTRDTLARTFRMVRGLSFAMAVHCAFATVYNSASVMPISANIFSSLPFSLACIKLSLPPTWTPPIKILGTVDWPVIFLSSSCISLPSGSCYTTTMLVLFLQPFRILITDGGCHPNYSSVGQWSSLSWRAAASGLKPCAAARP